MGESALKPEHLGRAFEKWWPELEDKMNTLPADEPTAQVQRSTADILDELLSLARGLSRDVNTLLSNSEREAEIALRAAFNQKVADTFNTAFNQEVNATFRRRLLETVPIGPITAPESKDSQKLRAFLTTLSNDLEAAQEQLKRVKAASESNEPDSEPPKEPK